VSKRRALKEGLASGRKALALVMDKQERRPDQTKKARGYNWHDFAPNLAITFLGTLAAFALAVQLDLWKQRGEDASQARWAANVVYAQTQYNYELLVRMNRVLRTEMTLIQSGNVPHVLDASPLPELHEGTDALLPLMAPTIRDADLMNRVLTATREPTVINSQIRHRDQLRLRVLENGRFALAVFRSDSVLLSNTRKLMGVIEEPDTLYKRLSIER
jgi:hypothetical protein